MIRAEIKRLNLLRLRWPALFIAPFSGNFREGGIGRIPMTHVDCQFWFRHDARLSSLQPLVPPPYSQVSPLDRRPRLNVVRIVMPPEANKRTHWNLQFS